MSRNNAWANFRLHRAVGALGPGEDRAPRTSIFPSIHETLVHILYVDMFYVGAVDGSLGDADALWAEMARAMKQAPSSVIREAQRQSDRRLVLLTESDGFGARLGDQVALPREGGHVQREMIADVLLHLFQHQIHHRGQVHAMLAGTTVAPPQLDEFYLREELPLRQDELSALGLPVE